MRTVFALVLTPLVGWSQATSPDDDRDDAIKLSPFVVDADDNTGYAPTETLSGTRLKSRVKDTASALTVLTPDLLNDLAIENIEEALDFVPNTEALTISEGDVAGFQNRNTVKSYVSRGITSTSYNINFFEAIAPVDRFSVEDFTFTRGPNSILFGTGSAGGLVNAQGKRARFSNFGSVEARTDDNGSIRGVLDVNRNLIDDRLALRVAALSENKNSYRKPAEDHRDSIYGTLTWKIADMSTLRVSAEIGEISRTVPWVTVFNDAYTPWIDAGSQTVATPQQANGAVSGTRWIYAAQYYVKIENESAANLPVMNWQRMAQGSFPVIGGAQRTDVPFLDASRSPIPIGTAFEGPGNKRDQQYDTVEAIFEQKLAEGLYLEVGAKQSHADYDDLTTIRPNSLFIYVDPNKQLPNGDPNPYVGMPYIENSAFAFGQDGYEDQQQWRAGLAYELDLRQAKWDLGHYQFGAFLTKSSKEVFTRWTREHGAIDNPIANARARQNWFHRRYYLEPNSPNFLQSAFETIVQQGDPTNVGVPDVHTGFVESHLGSILEELNLTGLSLVAQGFFWNDRIVYTAGWRRDKSESRRAQMGLGADGLFEPWNPATAIGGEEVIFTGNTTSHGLVLHLNDQVSVFGNQSSNFVPPNTSRTDFNGDSLPPVGGDGWDAGLRFELMDGRIVGSLSYYETTEIDRANAVIAQRKRDWIEMMWEAIDPGTYIQPSSAWADTEDRESSGYEFQLTANPTRNLRVYATLAKAKVVKSNLYPVFRNYWAANKDTFAANRNLAVDDTTNNNLTTVGGTYDALEAELALDLADEGGYVRNTRDWSGSLGMTYSFADTALDGLQVTLRSIWRQAAVIGFNLDSTNQPDGNNPIYGRDELTFDLLVGYRVKSGLPFLGGDLDLGVQVYNLLDNDDYIPLEALAYSQDAFYYNKATIPAPRTVAFTAKWRF